jgi:hypothetical protein
MMLRTAAVAFAATFACAAQADNPFEAFKGKVKPGLYEYTMEMDMGNMPGMPPGTSKQARTMQHCVTEEEVTKGQVGGGGGPGGKAMNDNCKVQDMKMSGNTATYKMVCKGGPDMTGDNKITFRSDGYTMDMAMDMQDKRTGSPMHMKQHVESKLLGPCSGR